MFSRAELLGGLPARRASTLLFAIEAEVARLEAASRIDRAAYTGERTTAERERQFLGALASGRALPRPPSIRALERFAPEWAALAPADPDGRAAVARVIGSKYRFRRVDVPRLRAALGLDEPDVAAAYERRHGEPIAGLYTSRIGLRERLRWRLSRAAARFDGLPPFWIAYFIALTETLGEGVMSVPLALAGLGPLPGVVLLLVVGAINLVTMGAMVEAVTRNGSMRFGTAYFGRLVTELLGRRSSVGVSVVLLAFNVVTLLVYLLGFASVLTGATGVHESIWVGALFLANLWFLRNETLDDTIASAVIVGVVNVGLVVGLGILAFLAIQPAHLAYADVPLLDGRPIDPSIVGLVLGVLLVAFFCHTAAANSSKLVLTLEPSGRSLLWGNLAALATVIALYCVVTIAILGALGPEPLLSTRGTSITPLAAVAGPGVNVLGALYVVLAVGLGSLYVTLGLYNQVIELLPRPATSPTGARFARLLATRRGRLLVGMAPATAVFVGLEALVFADQDWFAGPIAIAGVLAVPLLTGVLPMLLVRAARRKGEYVPGRVVQLLGHPVTVAALLVVFVVAVALHGLVIWDGAVERAAALIVAAVAVALIAGTSLRGAFRPRAVVEYRVDRKKHRSTLSVTSAGRTFGGERSVRAGEAVTAEVPAGRARTLRIWVHEVTPDGWSVRLPAEVEVRQGEEVRNLRIDDLAAEPVLLPLRGTAATVTIWPRPQRDAGERSATPATGTISDLQGRTPMPAT